MFAIKLLHPYQILVCKIDLVVVICLGSHAKAVMFHHIDSKSKSAVDLHPMMTVESFKICLIIHVRFRLSNAWSGQDHENSQ